MPSYHVKRSINIAAPLKSIHTSLCDFQQWTIWSPWLIAEPDAKLEYNDKQGEVGATYQWEGDLVGSGGMEILQINDNDIEMSINFVAPFKSSARVTFELESNGEETTVTWNMLGKLPFFLFMMLEKMKLYIGMDYERGLNMLKEYSEKGSISSAITIQGVVTQPPQKYIGIANNCTIKDIGSVMPADFKKLADYFAENNLSTAATAFAIYTEFDIEKQHASFISAIPIDENIDVIAPFITGETDKTEVIKVNHTGPYAYIGNGWAVAMMYSRANKLKLQKSPVGIEYYLSDPNTTAQAELITGIALPLK